MCIKSKLTDDINNASINEALNNLFRDETPTYVSLTLLYIILSSILSILLNIKDFNPYILIRSVLLILSTEIYRFAMLKKYIEKQQNLEQYIKVSAYKREHWASKGYIF